MRQIESLIQRLEATADPVTRAGVRELVEALLEYHGAAIARMLEMVQGSGPGGETTIREMGRDELTGSLLLLYGLHPDDLPTRVRRAVDGLAYLELAGIEDGVVRLRAQSAERVSREAVEQVIYAAAPEVAGIEIEPSGSQGSAFIPLEALLRV